jgi:hypothetical protein
MSQISQDQNFFQLTSEFVQHTSQHIFLTGKAGTGKTTALVGRIVALICSGLSTLNQIVAVTFTGLSLSTFGAEAAPWCAEYSSRGGGTNCGFYSFEQCQQTVRGIGGHGAIRLCPPYLTSSALLMTALTTTC